MRQQLLALYGLQKIDVRISQIDSRLAALDGARELKKSYLTAKAALEESEKVLNQKETEMMDAELKLKTIDEKRVKFEKRLYSGEIINPKELSAVEKEIATLKEQQDKLDTEVLGLYDTVDAARASAGDARNALQAAEGELRTALTAESVEKKQLETERADLASRREPAAAKVTDRALMSRYDTVRRKTGNTGAARLIDSRCEACHVQVTPYVTRKMAENCEYVSCESCGRILMSDVGDE